MGRSTEGHLEPARHPRRHLEPGPLLGATTLNHTITITIAHTIMLMTQTCEWGHRWAHEHNLQGDGIKGGGQTGIGEHLVEDMATEWLGQQALQRQGIGQGLVLRQCADKSLNDGGDMVGQSPCGQQLSGPRNAGDGVVAVGQ